MTTTKKITAAQAETLRTILAHGGKVRTHQGRLRRGGAAVNKGCFHRLLSLGLAEEVCETDETMRAAGRVCHVVLWRNATAAGCLALNAYDAAKAAKEIAK